MADQLYSIQLNSIYYCPQKILEVSYNHNENVSYDRKQAEMLELFRCLL